MAEYRALHTLSVPGLPFQLVVKVLSEPSPVNAGAAGDGDARQLQRKDKVLRSKKEFSHVLVGDESANIFLTFRTARSGDVKRGRFLLVTGVVTCHLGSLHLLCGPRPQDLQPLKHGVSMGPPAAFTNLSAVVHHVGTLVVRPLAMGTRSISSISSSGSSSGGGEGDGPPFVLQYGLLSHATSPRRMLYAGVTLPRSHESFPAAAQRALQEAMARSQSEEDEDEGQQPDFHLWSGGALPAITEFQSQDGTTHAYHFFLALQPPAEAAEAEAENEDENEGQETAFVWRTHAQVRAAARRRQAIKEDGRHVLPMVNKARHLLEEAVRHGALRGPGWDELHRYLSGPQDDNDTADDPADKASAFLAEAKAKAAGQGERRVLPVTVLSGFLGAGKTTLLKHLLQNQNGWKVAVLVNDMAEINVDAELVTRDRHVRVAEHRQERIVSLSNGCVCCTLREDMLEQVMDLATAGEYDYCIIEASGISEPLPVAETFSFTDSRGNAVADFARLDTTVTVVDAHAVRSNIRSVERAAGCRVDGAQEASGGGDDDKTLADLWVEQVEFADVIVLNKSDLLDSAELASLTALVQKLNPGAKVVPASYGRIEISAVMHTGLFSLEKAQSAPGWLKELRGEHVPETEEYGVSSFVYKRTRPFHPGRLHALLQEQGQGQGLLDCLIRVKGYAWLASRWAHMLFWSLAGAVGHSFSVSPHDTWLAATDPAEWPEGLDLGKAMEQWQPLWGDRRSEVVFIGVQMDKVKVGAALDACLLTPDEMDLGPAGWRRFDDPFPKIAHEHGDSSDEEEEEEGNDEEEDWEEVEGVTEN